MGGVLDTNVVLRFLLDDTEHPRYGDALATLNCGGDIHLPVFVEVTNVFRSVDRRALARDCAIGRGEFEIFKANPAAYTAAIRPPSGWCLNSNKNFAAKMTGLLQNYPKVSIIERDVYDKAIMVYSTTRYDWVDCWVVAKSILSGEPLYSFDKDTPKIQKLLQEAETATSETPTLLESSESLDLPEIATLPEPSYTPEVPEPPLAVKPKSDSGKVGKMQLH